MYPIILLLAIAYVVYRHGKNSELEMAIIPRRIGDRLTRLWEIAHHGMRENRLLRAEKALLTILKIDEKNAAAYNRLGILYAIDCFEIASSIEPSASSLHNLGLIYYETENFEKAATAFEEAIKLEDGLAARHIAYAKVQEKLGNDKLMMQELEKAAELEPNRESFALLAKAYETQGMAAEAAAINKQLNKIALPAGKPKRILRPKRVVI
jgi:tetratricopeptide (TPR) repeat protein